MSSASPSKNPRALAYHEYKWEINASNSLFHFPVLIPLIGIMLHQQVAEQRRRLITTSIRDVTFGRRRISGKDRNHDAAVFVFILATQFYFVKQKAYQEVFLPAEQGKVRPL
jgi:hypothetical protein